jgi:hypothetical protein
MKNVTNIAVVLSLAFALAPIGTRADRMTPSNGRTCALVVTGVSRDLNNRLATTRASNDLQAYLRDEAKLDAGCLTVLVGDDFGASDPNRVSTANNLKATLNKLAAVIRPQDRFLFCYLGQANAVPESLRFNLPGPDLAHDDLARALNAIKADKQLVVLDCPCAALTTKALTRRGRIILCASTATQVYSTAFTSRFVPALRLMQNDTNADGHVSVLEAFTATAQATERWYRQMECLATETPCLEDNGDGVPASRPWRYEVDGGDGLDASGFFLTTRKLEPTQTKAG